jgi:hypothetical protein
MENDEKLLSKVQAPEEGDLVDKNLVKLRRDWVFWENYEGKPPSQKLDWESSIKKIFEFSDIISFWQFMNSYQGSELPRIFFNGQSMK